VHEFVKKTNSILNSALEQSERSETLLNKIMENATNINKNISDLYSDIYQSRDSVTDISKTHSPFHRSPKPWQLKQRKVKII
jgi:hypothetical protein